MSEATVFKERKLTAPELQIVHVGIPVQVKSFSHLLVLAWNGSGSHCSAGKVCIAPYTSTHRAIMEQFGRKFYLKGTTINDIVIYFSIYGGMGFMVSYLLMASYSGHF